MEGEVPEKEPPGIEEADPGQETVEEVDDEMKDDAPPLDVEVMDVCGTSQVIDMNPAHKLWDLKVRLAELWDIPAKLQRLVCGADVLEDDRVIGSLQEGLEPDEPVTLLLVRVQPYDGDLNAACQAHDIEAIRMLMASRDKDRIQKVPAALRLTMSPGLGRQRDWAGIQPALLDRGYTQEEIDEGTRSVTANTYERILAYLLEVHGQRLPATDWTRWWKSSQSQAWTEWEKSQ